MTTDFGYDAASTEADAMAPRKTSNPLTSGLGDLLDGGGSLV